MSLIILMSYFFSFGDKTWNLYNKKQKQQTAILSEMLDVLSLCPNCDFCVS